MAHTPGPFTATEIRMMRNAMSEFLAGESDCTAGDWSAARSAHEKLGQYSADRIPVSLVLLQSAADAIDAATQCAFADEEERHPIARDWRRYEHRLRAAIAKATGSAA